MYQGTITRRMQTTRSDIYRSILTKRDFEAKLARLKKAEGSSQRPAICAALCDMFGAIGISCENRKEYDYYKALINETEFKSFEDIEFSIMETMFNNFDKYPTPEEYMLRIVRNLSDSSDNWQDDPLRLQILKRFIKYCNCLTFKSDNKQVNVYGGKGYIEKYAKEKKGSEINKGEDMTQYIDDGIFDALASATKDQKKSDGLSSCEQAKAGAEAACRAVTGFLLDHADRLFNMNGRETADSLITAAKDDKCYIVAMPGDSRNGCCTTTTFNAASMATVGIVDTNNVKSVMLCSDGAWELMYRRNRMKQSIKDMILRQDHDKLKAALLEEERSDDCSFIIMDIKKFIRRRSA